MKYTFVPSIALSIASLYINTCDAWARGPARSVAAVRTTTQPVIDGRLDDECWSQAQVTSGFIAFRTEAPAKEQTFVRILYDDQNLYVGFECIEPDPNRIVAMERKYDQPLKGEDMVEIRLDTFHDRRSAYVFMVNTLGTRYDCSYGIFGSDESWAVTGRPPARLLRTAGSRNWPYRSGICISSEKTL